MIYFFYRRRTQTLRRQYFCLGRPGQGKTACPAGKQFQRLFYTSLNIYKQIGITIHF